MRIEHLKLTNFRNYSVLDIDFNNNVNIFIGDNGKGKTNILESIYVLSLTKTNRYGVEENLIKFDEEVAKVEGIIRNSDLIKKQEISLTKNRKQTFINNKEIRRIKDYISNFCVISFTPSDLEIIKGSPNVRRNMINIFIFQILFQLLYSRTYRIFCNLLSTCNIRSNYFSTISLTNIVINRLKTNRHYRNL